MAMSEVLLTIAFPAEAKAESRDLYTSVGDGSRRATPIGASSGNASERAEMP